MAISVSMGFFTDSIPYAVIAAPVVDPVDRDIETED
jgi:hypothetical protein